MVVETSVEGTVGTEDSVSSDIKVSVGPTGLEA